MKTALVVFSFFACAPQPGEPTGGPTIEQTLDREWCAVDHTYKLHDVVEYNTIDHDGHHEKWTMIVRGFDGFGAYKLSYISTATVTTANEHALELITASECEAPASQQIGLYSCEAR